MPKNKDLLDKLKMKSKPKSKEEPGVMDYLKEKQGNIEDWMNKNVNEPLAKKGYKTAGATLATLGSLPTAFAVDTAEDVKGVISGNVGAMAALTPWGKVFKGLKGAASLGKAIENINPVHQKKVTKFFQDNPKLAEKIADMDDAEVSVYLKKNKDSLGREGSKMLKFIQSGKTAKPGHTLNPEQAQKQQSRIKNLLHEIKTPAKMSNKKSSGLTVKDNKADFKKAELTDERKKEIAEIKARNAEKWNAPVETVTDNFKKSTRKNIKRRY